MTTVLMSFLLSTDPDPRGNWKLSGLSVDYLHIARETTPFYLTVDYPELAGTSFATDSDCGEAGSTSICVHLQDIPAGVMFNRLTNGPFTDAGLGGIGVNLNVNIYDGGNGTIAQGSFYPDIELSESQECVTDLQIFAVNENFSWEVGTQTTFSESNVLGMENGLLCTTDDPNTPEVGDECPTNTDEAWGFGLVTGLFDETPATPVPVALPPGLPYVALTDGTILGASCQTALVGAACAALDPPISAAADADGCSLALVMAGQLSATQDGSGPLEQSIQQCELATNPAYGGTYAGSAAYGGAGWLHGTGTSSKFNIDQGASAMCDTPGCNPDVDFKLVWHALDSQETGLGFGDIDYPADGWDEDGDGSEFDRIFGVPYIEVTHLNTANPLCDVTGGTADGNDFNLPLAGNILSTLGATAGCDELATYDAQYACGAGVVDAFITDNCYAGVVDAVTDTCTSAGGVANLVYLGCVEQATGEVATTCAGAVAQAQGQVTAGCETYCISQGLDDTMGDTWTGCNTACYDSGIDAAEAAAITAVIEGTCLAAGGPATSNPDVAGGLTCADLAGAYATAADGDCSVAVGLASQSCTDSNGGSLCCLAGGIGVATTPTCDDFAASYDNDDLDEAFADTTGGVTCEAYGDNFVGWCLEDSEGNYNGDNDTEMYLFQPGAGLDAWGDFMTYNGAVFSSLATQAQTGLIPCGTDENGDPAYGSASDLDGDNDVDATDITMLVASCNPDLMVNDSDHDFNPGCFLDDSVDCSGRLTMTFEPTCVPEIEARQIVAEFVDLTDLCNHSGDVDYSCAAYDWNYNYLADTAGDGISEADCSAFAAATGQAYVVNNGPVLPSCDDDITTNCTEYSATVVWNAAYNMCGDGDPNDLIDLGVNGFCGPAVAAGAFDAAATAPVEYGGAGCPSADYVVDANGTTCAFAACAGFYASQGGVPSFEQNCTVGDGTVSVTDVVRIINHIIGNDSTFGNSVDQLGGEAACEADFNNDGNINVVDVVAIVNSILAGQGGRVADASEASISIENDKIVVSADGFVGAVDIIVEFTDNFSFDIADGFASTSRVNGNRAHIILIGDKDGISDVLTMTSGKIVGIEEVLVANSSDFVTTSINQPSIFSVGAAYPNPFNPSTNISLVLNANADLSVKVYNLTGQLVDVIAEGNYSPSSYNWTWKAENLASGVYFIKAQVGSEISTQKVMLLK